MDSESRKRNKIFKDRFSELPDDVLSFTLSFMPIKEASRTSILSSRWRYLWKDSVKFSSSLALDAISMSGSNYSSMNLNNGKFMAVERRKFIRWADQILQLGYGSLLKTFRLSYVMNRRFSRHIDKWIRLSIAKGVQNFDIDLSEYFRYLNHPNNGYYTFPGKLFSKEAGALVKCLYLNCCILGPLDFKCFSSLVDLKLVDVLVDQDDVTKFLTECPNLERMWLEGCYNYSSITISGPSLKLIELTIVSYERLILRDIKLNAKNLNKFNYWGSTIKFLFHNVPMLSNVLMVCKGEHCSALRYVLGELSTDLPKLETLFLEVYQPEVFLERRVSFQLPSYKNLRKLMVTIVDDNRSLWGLVSLLCTTPFLCALELHLFPSYLNLEFNPSVGERPFDSPHLHLKEILLTGFNVSNHEMQFVRYLFENCVALQTMTLDSASKNYHPHRGMYDCYSSVEKSSKMKKLMHRRVKKFFMPVVPSRVKVIIL